MKRLNDNNYEQGYYTGFCQYNLNSEIKPGKWDKETEPFTHPRLESLNTLEDVKRIDCIKGIAK